MAARETGAKELGYILGLREGEGLYQAARRVVAELAKAKIPTVTMVTAYASGEEAGKHQAEERIKHLEEVLAATLREVPVGNLHSHTVDNLPALAGHWVSQAGVQAGNYERLRDAVHQAVAILNDATVDRD